MFEEIIKKIEQYDSIVIFGHLNPDGDCYGSQIALKAILKKQFPNKDVFITGSGIPKFFLMLGDMDNVSLETIKNSLAIILDSNDLQRVEDKRVFSALDYAKIDHHINTFTFTEGPEVIDDKSTSTSELIYRFAREHSFEIPLVAANALYLGIFTDTGRFQYAYDYVKMFEIAKNLVQIGVEPTKLLSVLNITPEWSLDVKGYIYNHYTKDPDGILYVIATNKDRAKLGITSAQMVGNTSLISHIFKYPVWFIASETDNGGMQVEMRSEGTLDIDVQKVAVSFGGGGHTYAAGFTIKEFSQENIDKLILALKQAIKESEK